MRGMYRTLCLFLLAALTVSLAENTQAENTKAVRDRIGRDIQYLASDDLEGRGVGTEGISKAADFVRTRFKEVGLASGVEDGSYFQPFKVNLDPQVVKEKTHLV